MNKHILPLLLLVLITLLGACKSSSKKDRESAEIEMSKYISKNNVPDSLISASGLIQYNTKVGEGDTTAKGYSVSIRYKLMLLKDSSVIKENINNFTPYNFTLNGDYYSSRNSVPGNFDGLHEALLSMREGGKATLVLPYRLGQGANGINTIPDYANLILEVELTNVAY